MLTDTILQDAEKKSKDIATWGNYDQLYDWIWAENTPALIPKSQKATAGIFLRDWTIAKTLKEKGIKRVLDIGSDTGHFMAVLKYYGIEAVGIDANKKMCEFIANKGQNKCYNIGIETLVNLDIKEYDCITCMNITHAKWEDESSKINFVNWLSKNTNYIVLSDFTSQDRNWKNLKMVHTFNFLPFNYSPFFERVFRYFKLEKIVTYSCIQKLYQAEHHA